MAGHCIVSVLKGQGSISPLGACSHPFLFKNSQIILLLFPTVAHNQSWEMPSISAVSSQPQTYEKLHCSSSGLNITSSCWLLGQCSIFISRVQIHDSPEIHTGYVYYFIMSWIHWPTNII